jgi:hypothetical protein
LLDGLKYPELYGLLPLPHYLTLQSRNIFFKSVFTVVKCAINMEKAKSVIWEFSHLLDIKSISKFVKRQKSNTNTFWDHFLDIDMTPYHESDDG